MTIEISVDRDASDDNGLVLNQYVQMDGRQHTIGKVLAATLFVPANQVGGLIEQMQETLAREPEQDIIAVPADGSRAFYQRLFKDQFDCFHVEYSSDYRNWTRLIPNLTKEQASYMHCDGWPIVEERSLK